ncbi:putative glucan endo-1,3-beta-glucosidase btgC [Smittium culicis]|uniref:glucan endo-1,3-beta-D-glucosidase n=1 Tax=Smittium culicis TaxID=133412 RepID=A0A1R1XIB9_9FUNG|nr:putative glucan endo-1,3-beta-glucosidase btgC [Smittium culicis]
MSLISLFIFVILALTLSSSAPIPSILTKNAPSKIISARAPKASSPKSLKRNPQTAPAVSSSPPSVSYQETLPFVGMTYSPYNPDGSCPDLQTVASQLTFLSKHTSSIRLYSTDCNQLTNVLAAISQNSLPLKVHAGIWASNGLDRANTEIDVLVAAAQNNAYSQIIADVSVGNEVIFNNLLTEDQVIALINTTKQKLSAAGISIPVYTTEVDSKMTKNLANACDLIQVNIQTFFDSNYSSIQNSVDQVFTRLDNIRTSVANGKHCRIGEVGYPHAGQLGPQAGSIENKSQYIQSFVCKAKNSGVTYFIFEALDATWKAGSSVSEQSYGIFNRALTPNIAIPSLSSC